jgi:hypothetical protein
MRGCQNVSQIKKYVLAYGISQDKASFYASALCSIASMVESYNSIVSWFGIRPSKKFATPSEILVGNIKSGVLIPVEPLRVSS